MHKKNYKIHLLIFINLRNIRQKEKTSFVHCALGVCTLNICSSYMYLVAGLPGDPIYPCSFKSSTKSQELQPKSSRKSPSSEEPSMLTYRGDLLNRCRALSCLQAMCKLLKTSLTEDFF